VHVFSQHIILLNSLDVCDELLNKRSAIYSGRPVLPLAGEMCVIYYLTVFHGFIRGYRVGWDRQLILSQDGDRHKAMRKLVARYIGTRFAVAALSNVQESEARWFVLRMSETPEDVLSHIRLYVRSCSIPSNT
jgi:cytochrome P450